MLCLISTTKTSKFIARQVSVLAVEFCMQLDDKRPGCTAEHAHVKALHALLSLCLMELSLSVEAMSRPYCISIAWLLSV